MSKELSKDEILILSSRDKGLRVHKFNKEQDQLRRRMSIFHLQGFVSVQYEKDCLCYRLKKETYLL
jgi:hypothetical protein